MAKSPEIFALVRSMTTQEKRFFKVFHAKAAEDKDPKNHYLLLFDDLNDYVVKAERDDEEEFQRMHASKPYSAHFSFHKTFLMGKIAHACLNMTNDSIDHRLAGLVAEARFYWDRRLQSTASKKLNKAHQLAKRYEKHEVLLEILRMKRTHCIEGHSAHRVDPRPILEELTQVGEVIRNKIAYLRIKDILFLKQKETTRERDPECLRELSDLMGLPEMQDEGRALSFDARHSFHFAKAIYHQLAGEWQEAMAQHSCMFHLWIGAPDMQEDRPVHFRSMLANYLNFCCSEGCYDHFDEALAIMEQPRTSSRQEWIESLQNSIYIRLTHEISRCNWQKVDEMRLKYEEHQVQIERKIHTSRKMAFYLHFAWFELVNQRYGQANGWIERILTTGKLSIRDDIRNFALLFKPIIRISQEDSELLEHDATAAYRHLMSQKELLPYEKAAIQFYKKWLRLTKMDEKIRAAEALKQELEALSTSSSSRNALGFEIMITWLESIVRQLDLRSVVEEKWLAR